MLPENAVQSICKIQKLLRAEQIKTHHRLLNGLAIKDYQTEDRNHKALSIAFDILETLRSEYPLFCAENEVEQGVSIITAHYDDLLQCPQSNDGLTKLMGGIGFLAVDMGLPVKAEALFHILALQAPDNIHPLLGIVYAKLAVGAAHKALEVIRDRVLNIAPKNDLGLAFLALTYDQLNKSEEAMAAASAVITANRDESAVSLAREVCRSQ